MLWSRKDTTEHYLPLILQEKGFFSYFWLTSYHDIDPLVFKFFLLKISAKKIKSTWLKERMLSVDGPQPVFRNYKIDDI